MEKKTTVKQLQEQASEGILQNRCPENFTKITGKATTPELFLIKMQAYIKFYKRLLQQLSRTSNGIWCTRNNLVKMYTVH